MKKGLVERVDSNLNIALFGAVGILMDEPLQETPLSSVLRNLDYLGIS